MSAILSKDVPPLSESGHPISPGLERIVAHCLEKRPEERFQSARDLAFDLGSLASATSAPDGGGFVEKHRTWRSRVASTAAALGIAALAAWAGARYGSEARRSPEPTFRRLTFRRGNLLSARFAPDGRTVVYAAAWEGKPTELFSVRTDSVESHPLGIERAEILDVSPAGHLAILRKSQEFFASGLVGTLARVPLGGGNPRELVESVVAGSWAPDGEQLAILRDPGDGKHRLEYPIGHVLFESYRLRAPIRISPDGELVAVLEHEENNTQSKLWVVRRNGEKRTVARYVRRLSGFAWSSDSKEIFFVGGKSIEGMGLRAVDLSGRERLVLPAVGSGLRLHDVVGGRTILAGAVDSPHRTGLPHGQRAPGARGRVARRLRPHRSFRRWPERPLSGNPGRRVELGG